jgi:hypothetical protein
LPFNKSQISTSSFQLSTFTFTLLWGHHLLFGEAGFHIMKDRSHKDLNTTDSNTEVTENFSHLQVVECS